VPQFPTPEGQSLENWLKTFEPYQDKVNSETIFVGHSIGPEMMLRLLERRTTSIKAAILAAPFDDFIGEEPYDTLNKTFIDHPFDYEKIKQNCLKFTVFAGDDDPYVPNKLSQNVANGLGVELKLIKKGKHLGENFKEFPEVLEEIKKLIDWFGGHFKVRGRALEVNLAVNDFQFFDIVAGLAGFNDWFD